MMREIFYKIFFAPQPQLWWASLDTSSPPQYQNCGYGPVKPIKTSADSGWSILNFCGLT